MLFTFSYFNEGKGLAVGPLHVTSFASHNKQMEEDIHFSKSLHFFQMSLKELMTCLRSHS